MQEVARAFQLATWLTTSEIDICTLPNFPSKVVKEHTTFYTYVEDCFHVVLWGRNSRRKGLQLFALFFFEEPRGSLEVPPKRPPEELENPIDRCYRLCVVAQPEVAEQFGRELQAECLEAKRLRRELGIYTWDDVDDLSEVEDE